MTIVGIFVGDIVVLVADTDVTTVLEEILENIVVVPRVVFPLIVTEGETVVSVLVTEGETVVPIVVPSLVELGGWVDEEIDEGQEGE